MLDALLLGLIEGLTEFLPISSTGHLLIAEHWLGERSELFNVVIQAGAILAVTLVYRVKLMELARGWREPGPRDYLLKLVLSFAVTSVLGLVAKARGYELPKTVTPVAAALVIGGLLIFAIEFWAKRQAPKDTVTWKLAVLVGVAQVVAGVFPGTSRSAAAIFTAMLCGCTDRRKAAEFAFLLGIPTMFGASIFELRHLAAHGELGGEIWSQVIAATVVSAVTGFASVVWLLRYVSSHNFNVFAWYRIALGIGLLVFFH